jgi:quercetin dioxygenase-like cupin family protein
MKYFVGSYKDFSDRKGWFIGDFFENDNPLKTDKVEVMYREHNTGDHVALHKHEHKVEVLVLVQGKAKYVLDGQENVLTSGMFLFAHPGTVISGEFLEKSEVFAIHSPSITTDKIEVTE